MKKKHASADSSTVEENGTPVADVEGDHEKEPVADIECKQQEEPPLAGGRDVADSGQDDELRELERKVAEYYDTMLRTKAECENIKRRSQEEISKAHRFAVEKFAAEMLAVKDSLETAYANTETIGGDVRIGLEVTLKQFNQALHRSGVQEINPAGEKFDPHWHQAISTTPSDLKANTVVQVIQKGYAIYDRVLRPAMVIVSARKET